MEQPFFLINKYFVDFKLRGHSISSCRMLKTCIVYLLAICQGYKCTETFILCGRTRLQVGNEGSVAVFWVVTQCIDVVGYQCFRGSCCLHLQGEVKIEAAWSSEMSGSYCSYTQCRNPEDHDFNWNITANYISVTFYDYNCKELTQ
jgi:hypothetical protein